MEPYTLLNDIKVFYVTAKSFPDGVKKAHETLHSMVPFSTERRYFGISRPEKNGTIVYHAAAEELEHGEAEKLNCETLVIKKGNYISETIHDFMKDIPRIGECFQKLLKKPDIDPEGYCVEWFISDKDVKCMVRLK